MAHQKREISDLLFNAFIMFAFIITLAVFHSNGDNQSHANVDPSSMVGNISIHIDALPVFPPRLPDYDDDQIVSEIIGLSVPGDYLLSLLRVNQCVQIKYELSRAVYQRVRQKDEKKVSMYYDFSPDADAYPSIS